MPLRKQTVAIPFGTSGVQEGVGKAILDSPGLTDLRDARFNKRGELEKRFGEVVTGFTGVIGATHNGLYTRKSTLFSLGSEGVNAFDDVETKEWRQPNVSAPRPSRLLSDPLARGNGSYVMSDIAFSSADNLVCVVYEDVLEDAIRVTFLDATTGDRIIETRVESTLMRRQPKVVFVNGVFILFAMDNTIALSSAVTASIYNPTANDYLFGNFVVFHTAAGREESYDVHHAAGETTCHVVVARTGNGWTAYEIDNVPSTVNVRVASTGRDLIAVAILHNPAVNLVYVLFPDRATAPDQLSLDRFADDYLSAPIKTKVIDYSVNLSGKRRCTFEILDSITNTLWCCVSHSRANGSDVGGLEFVDVSSAGVAGSELGFEPGLILSQRARRDSLGRIIFGGSREVIFSPVDAPLSNFEPLPVAFLLTPTTFFVTDPADFPQQGDPVQGVFRRVHTVATLGRYAHDFVFTRSFLAGTKIDDHWVHGQVLIGTEMWGPITVQTASNPAVTAGGIGYPVIELHGWQWGIDLYRADVDPPPMPATEVEGNTIVAGGVVGSFDGGRYVEANIPTVPHACIKVQDTVGAAPLLANLVGASGINYVEGASIYDFTAEGLADAHVTMEMDFRYILRWVDADGNIHRSAVSESATLIMQGNGKSGANQVFAVGTGPTLIPPENRNMFIPLPSHTAVSGEDGIRIKAELYRTSPHFKLFDDTLPGAPVLVRDDDNRGDVFLLVTNQEIGLVDTIYRSLGWLEDQTIDPTQAPGLGGPIPYSDAELDSEPIPSAIDIVATQRRLFFLNGADRLEIWYSKPLIDAVAPEFHNSQRIRVSAEGGDCLALAAMDDKIIALKRGHIYVASAVGGPDANGDGVQLANPRLVATDTGCINANSVATGPFGVVYESVRGLYRLDRGLQTHFLGEPIRDTLEKSGTGSTKRTIVGAEVVASQNEVRWQMADDAGTILDVLVWNYLRDSWSLTENLVGVASAIWVDRYARLLRNGNVAYEVADTYNPAFGGEHPLLEVTTAWMKLAGLQGFQRIWTATILGEYNTGSVRVEVGFNYLPAFIQTDDFDETDLAAEGSKLQLKIKPIRQKSESIRFRISERLDFGGATVGAGIVLQGIQLEVGVKPGSFKHVVPPNRA